MNAEPSATPTKPPQPTPVAMIDPTTVPTLEPVNGKEISVVAVDLAREECYAMLRRMCLVVDGELWYQEIEGFNHEPGYEYRLRIERYDRWPGLSDAEIPQDVGRYGYRLLEVISKTPAAGTP